MSNVDKLEQMFTAQLELQKIAKSVGCDPGALPMPQRILYMKEMTLALTDELHEMLAEMSWKSWTHGEPFINDDKVQKELIDAWHFLMNLMLAANITPAVLFAMYMRKRQVNVDRQVNEYDGVSTKCIGCKRALEDVALREVSLSTGIAFFCECNTQVPNDIARPFLID